MNFGTHEKAKFWNYSLNAKGPSEYALNSHKMAWFTWFVSTIFIK